MNRVPFALAGISFAAALAACSTLPVTRYQYPANANPDEEIALVDQQIQTGYANQYDVLSPDHFKTAQEELLDAKKNWRKRHDAKSTFENLGLARGHLDAAMTIANTAQRAMPEVVNARSQALNANAQSIFPEALHSVDQNLEDHTSRLDHGKEMSISVKDRNELQRKYMDVELVSLKAFRLGGISREIDTAKKLDAQKWAPESLVEAESAFHSAENVIATDRHNQEEVNAAVSTAQQQADKLEEVARLANAARGPNSETVALELWRRHQTIRLQNSELENQSIALQASNAALSNQAHQFQMKEKLDQAIIDAQEKFDPKEAQVIRKENKLLIRLKKTGSKTLAKVKEVIGELNASQVTLEDHTRSTKQAEAVAKYLEAKGALKKEQVTVRSAGRAGSRGVDVLIEPDERF